MPHRVPLLNMYNISVYLDANVRVIKPLSPLLAKFDASKSGAFDLGFFDFEHTLQREAQWVQSYLDGNPYGRAWLKKQNETALEQVAEYLTAFETTLKAPQYPSLTNYGKVVVRSNNYRTRFFNELWWHEYCRGVPSDQLSYKY